MDLPTPPFPDRIKIFRFTLDILCFIKGSDGSGSFVAPEAQIAWLSQPAQASDLPASSDSVPWMSNEFEQIKGKELKRTGQCSGAFEGMDLGSGIAVGGWTSIIAMGERDSNYKLTALTDRGVISC